MNRPNLRVALLLAAGGLVAGLYTVIGIATRKPDFLVAVLFVVLAAGAVDGFTRRTVTGRYGPAYLPANALLVTGSTVPGAVLLTIAAGAFVLHRFDSRRRAAGGTDDAPPPPPAGPAA